MRVSPVMRGNAPAALGGVIRRRAPHSVDSRAPHSVDKGHGSGKRCLAITAAALPAASNLRWFQ